MKYVVSIVALLLLSGCSDTGAVKDAITEGLKDPTSAEFGEISIVDGVGGKFACATVNARNSFGGYTGDQQIMLQHHDAEGWTWAGEGTEQPHKSCVDFITSMAKDDGSEAAQDAAQAGAEAAAPAASERDMSQAGAEAVP